MIQKISRFLYQCLGVSLSDFASEKVVYQGVVLKYCEALPLPNECKYVTDDMCKSLIWLYSHPYFTSAWIIQGLNAGEKRVVRCGHEPTDWLRVELVAGHIIMESAFSRRFGFSSAHCW